jgi:hypothetical protein
MKIHLNIKIVGCGITSEWPTIHELAYWVIDLGRILKGAPDTLPASFCAAVGESLICLHDHLSEPISRYKQNRHSRSKQFQRVQP